MLSSKIPQASILIALLSVIGLIFCSEKLKSLSSNHEMDRIRYHTVPSLLSVVDDRTNEYVFVQSNPIYDKLRSARFLDNESEWIESDAIIEPPSLHLNRQIIGLRDSLTVSWSLGRMENGHNVVQDDDIIVLYCGETIKRSKDMNRRPFLDAATIAQAKATSQKHYRETTGRSLNDTAMWYFPSFPVERQEACQFYLYKFIQGNILSHVATTEILHIRNGESTPTAIHLALSNNNDEMVVQFKTGISGTPVVKYGLHKDSLQLNAVGTSHTYSAKDLCQEPATLVEAGKFQWPGQLHLVTLKQLLPNTQYHYMVGVKDDHGNINWSGAYSFQSAPDATSNPENFSFIVYGDQGCPANGWGQASAWIAAMTAREIDHGKNPVRAVHHFGDLSYAMGAAHIWDEWLNMISAFTTSVPLMISVGNHEYDYLNGDTGKDPSGEAGLHRPAWARYFKDSNGECGVPLANLFTMPNSTNSNAVFWYSFDHSTVHTIVVSSEHDLSHGSPQHKWLEADIRSVDRQKTPWIILELHRPLYESEVDPLNSFIALDLRRQIESLLKPVDLVLAGHYHSYQRTCAGLYKGKCNNGGPIHITVGTAGAKPNHGRLFPGLHWVEKFYHGIYGYGRITIANASALHFELIQAGAADDPNAGKVLDETWIIKEHTLVDDRSPVRRSRISNTA